VVYAVFKIAHELRALLCIYLIPTYQILSISSTPKNKKTQTGFFGGMGGDRSQLFLLRKKVATPPRSLRSFRLSIPFRTAAGGSS